MSLGLGENKWVAGDTPIVPISQEWQIKRDIMLLQCWRRKCDLLKDAVELLLTYPNDSSIRENVRRLIATGQEDK